MTLSVNTTIMTSLNEIASITVLVSNRTSDTVTSQDIIPFRVYQDEQRFTAIPLINDEERKRTFLPNEVHFDLIDQRFVPGKDMQGNVLDVISNIIQELKMQKLL